VLAADASGSQNSCWVLDINERVEEFRPQSEEEKRKRYKNSDVGGSRPRTRSRIQQQFYVEDNLE
jgi:hypothetical protein